MTYGPQVPHCDAQHAAKYRGPSESFEEAMNRIAVKYAPQDEYKQFRDILLNMRFLPGGRIQSAFGTAHNCFVSGTVEDSLRVGEGSITQRLDEALGTLQMGGGIGYDFSVLRPRGAVIKTLNTHSGGPLPFMSIFDSACKCISAAGHRRGAQMGVLRVDHPDIEEFIHAKQTLGQLEAFNISIAVTDEFMVAVRDDLPFDLRWGGEVWRTIDARALWETIMRSTWDWGEPGVIFIDRINDMNNLWYCEKIAATNPCGEQPLPPFGACLLGSFNLVAYLNEDRTFNTEQFRSDIYYVVSAMDRVIDVSQYPLEAQKVEAESKRRMGLGVTGVANAIEAMGHSYGSPDFLETLQGILGYLRDEAYRASVVLAAKRGPFPLYDGQYLSSKFIRNLPKDIRTDIAATGIRNSHLLSIAPAGTISLCADNISSGIEPVFAYAVDRKIIGDDQVARTFRFEDYGKKFLDVEGKLSKDVTVKEHLGVLAVAQSNMDSAVSKTCNVDGSMEWEDFKAIYFDAWKSGCKGCTTYNADGKRNAVLTSADNSGESCKLDEGGRMQCD